ncbi:hypothetical protein LWF15_06305 [Kineosporia rhizophila]|uniref:hypothetical protein n=1 Tax=Kineosporia TaxID=49184 RepID=UPI001E6453FB|nr:MULTISPECIES: hypothetical protein [Kineosporia]MCE0535113.1 hypothetical protein [Kineosporia rhizophila]GLY14601.1 glycosyl transferase [Kineosporia sp. NBRC 101677]
MSASPQATPVDQRVWLPRPRREDPSGPVLVLVALAALGFGLAATAGLWADPAGRFVAGNVPDAIHYSWWLGHTPHSLGEVRSPFETQDLNYPTGVGAMNNTTLLLPAVLLAPVTVLVNSVLTLNILNLLAVPACFAAGYWALRKVPGVSSGAAAVGAAAFAVSPAIVNSLTGHITMALAPGLPILIALSVEAWRTDHRRSSRWDAHGPIRVGFWLGLVALLQVFLGEEVLFQAGLGALLILLTAAVFRPRQIKAGAARLARTLLVAFTVFLPLAAYPLYLQFFGPHAHHGSPFTKDYFGADVTAFFTPTPGVLLHRAADLENARNFPGGIEEHLAYLGWPLIITCLITIVLGWRMLAVRCAAVGLLVSAALSLGGRLWIDGVWTEHRGPYHLLQELPVTEASLATRLGLLVALFSGVLLALAVQGLRSGSRHRLLHPASRPSGRTNVTARAVGAVAVSVACLAPLLPAAIPVVDAPETPQWFTSQAQDLPNDTVVVVLPYPVPTLPTAMRWQSEAGYPFRMPGGYFLGPAEDGQAYVGGAADPATARLLSEVQYTGVARVVTPADRAQAQADLQAWGADKIVLGPDQASDALRRTVSDLLEQAPVSEGGVEIWEIR